MKKIERRAASCRDLQMRCWREIRAMKTSLATWGKSTRTFRLGIAQTLSTWKRFAGWKRKRKLELMFNELWVQAWQERFSSGKSVYFIHSYTFSHMIVHMLGILNGWRNDISFPRRASSLFEQRRIEKKAMIMNQNRSHLQRLAFHRQSVCVCRWFLSGIMHAQPLAGSSSYQQKGEKKRY